MTKYALLAPGQGAQYVGMGRDFFENGSAFRAVIEEASDLLKEDLATRIFESDESALKESSLTQLSIFLVGMGIFREIEKNFPNLNLKAALGLSLGEYTALTAAGVIPFKETLFLVRERGIAMNEAAKSSPGGMVAVIGLSSDKIEKVLLDFEGVWISSYNTEDQTVIGGNFSALEGASLALKQALARRCIPLAVGGAFHTPLMAKASERMAPLIRNLPIKAREVEVFMNALGDQAKDLGQLKEALLSQLTAPTRFVDCLKKLSQTLCEVVIEVGPSKSLSAMARKCGLEKKLIAVDRYADLEALSSL